MGKCYRHLYPSICDWDNLWLAWRKARRGKRSQPPAATFEMDLDRNLLTLMGRRFVSSATVRAGLRLNNLADCFTILLVARLRRIARMYQTWLPRYSLTAAAASCACLTQSGMPTPR